MYSKFIYLLHINNDTFPGLHFFFLFNEIIRKPKSFSFTKWFLCLLGRERERERER